MSTTTDGTPSYTDAEVIELSKSTLSADPSPDPWAEPKQPSVFSKAWGDMKYPFVIGIGGITTIILMIINTFVCFWFGSIVEQWTGGGDTIAMGTAFMAILISVAIWWYVFAIINVILTEYEESK